MNVKEIVAEYLKTNGFDGLHAEDQCGCRLDDLIPCDDACGSCTAGYLLPGDEDSPWYIGEKLAPEIAEAVANVLTTGKAVPCVKCGSKNIKCRGSIWNCEDCGFTW